MCLPGNIGNSFEDFDAAIPLRSADTDAKKTRELQHTIYCKTHGCDVPVPMHKVLQHMQNTIALQHTTVQHIALMHQFQCTKCVNTCKTQKHNSAASTRTRKGHLASSHCAHFEQDSTAKRRRLRPSRARAYFSPQRKLRLPEKTPCLVQILTLKSHPRCSSSNAICQEWLAKHKTIARHYWRPSTFRDTLTQPFHCDLQTRTWKRQGPKFVISYPIKPWFRAEFNIAGMRLINMAEWWF